MLTLPSHKDPPLDQFLGNPLLAHEILGNLGIGQILEWLQFSPICAINICIRLEVLSLKSMFVEVDDFAFQERDNMCIMGW